MANKNESIAQPVTTPFSEEKPKIVHLEKNESHYEYCRVQMREVERVYHSAFLCNMVVCLLVCFLAIFRVRVELFSFLSTAFDGLDEPGAILTGGIMQIIVSMFIMLFGYLAWANYHFLNLLSMLFYSAVTVMGVLHLDYLSGVLGVAGVVFYGFAIQAMRREGALSEMEGYPDFHEKFDISKSDIVIQTLLAHRGERSSIKQPNLFRRKRKKHADAEETPVTAAPELAEVLAKQVAVCTAEKNEPAKPVESVKSEKIDSQPTPAVMHSLEDSSDAVPTTPAAETRTEPSATPAAPQTSPQTGSQTGSGKARSKKKKR